MNRWLMIGSMVGLLTMTTGCLHHHTRGGCQSCGDSKSSGLLGKLGSRMSGGHHAGGCRTGCVAGPIGWQQGGLNYSDHLCPGGCGNGACGACGAHGTGYTAHTPAGLLGHGAAHQIQNQPFTPGPPTAQVGYPYYTHRGPRDFLLDNPPSIGR